MINIGQVLKDILPEDLLKFGLIPEFVGRVPVIVTLVYGLVMLYLNGIRKVDGPYPFFRVHYQSAMATVLWMVALMAVMTGISAGVWAIAR